MRNNTNFELGNNFFKLKKFEIIMDKKVFKIKLGINIRKKYCFDEDSYVLECLFKDNCFSNFKFKYLQNDKNHFEKKYKINNEELIDEIIKCLMLSIGNMDNFIEQQILKLNNQIKSNINEYDINHSNDFKNTYIWLYLNKNNLNLISSSTESIRFIFPTGDQLRKRSFNINIIDNLRYIFDFKCTINSHFLDEKYQSFLNEIIDMKKYKLKLLMVKGDRNNGL